MAGALEHAAGLGLQRIDVAALDDVVGALGGSTAVRIVCARSAALMPVVTPSRASIVTVNGVWCGVSFLEVISSRPEVVAAIRRQRQADPAAGVGRHEVDRVRRDVLGGHHEVALVLAVLVVDDDDHLARRRCPPGPPRRSRTRRSQERTRSFSTYLATMSTSRLTGAPDRGATQRGPLEGLGDERDVEATCPPTAATVRQTPSTAIEPFSTT